MADVKYSPDKAGQFIVGEATVGATGVSRSRSKILIASGSGVLAVGTILGMVTATREYTILDPAAVDGTEKARGFLFDEVDATSAAAPGVGILRDAQVNASEVVYPDGITAGQILTATYELDDRGLVFAEVGADAYSASAADAIPFTVQGGEDNIAP